MANWYGERIKEKSRPAKALRVFAIVMAGLAGLIPLLQQVFEDTLAAYPYVLQPAWATVMLGAATVGIGLDRFFGYSSGWIRYVHANVEITNKVREFKIRCQEERAGWGDGVPTREQVMKGLAIAGAFMRSVDGVMMSETEEWMAEFRAAVSRVDGELKEAQERVEQSEARVATERARSVPGAVNLALTNGDKAQGGWKVRVDGQEREARGTEAAIDGLAAGLRRLEVEGVMDGKKASAERVVEVEPGKVVEVELTLKSSAAGGGGARGRRRSG